MKIKKLKYYTGLDLIKSRNARKSKTPMLYKRKDGNLCRGHLKGFNPEDKRIPVPGCVACDRKLILCGEEKLDTRRVATT